NSARGAHVFVCVFEVVVGEDNAAAHALDRFGDITRNAARGGVVDQVLYVGRVILSGLRMFAIPLAAIRIRSEGVMDTEAMRHIKLPGVMRSKSHAGSVAAVVSISQCNHVVIAGVNPSHEQGEIIGFGTGIDEVTNL